MQIHKLSYPSSVLAALPRERLSAFLLLGHFLNETNWLQKLLVVAAQDETGHAAEVHARMALSLMLTKVFAAKIHEGWNRMSSGALKATLDTLTLSPRTQERRQQLAERLRAESIVHKVRKLQAFHYPTSLSLDGLPGVAQGDVALYLTQHAGDTLSLISELSAASEMNAIAGIDHVGQSLNAVLTEVVDVSGLYGDFLHGTLEALINESITAEPLDEVIDNADAPLLQDVRLRFFATPPGSPAES